MLYLGIDTSNYTTSVSVYDDVTEKISMEKLPLPVKNGELGLRQSDALFAHVKQIGQVFNRLAKDIDKNLIKSVSVSAYPRSVKNSYMPCFLVGQAVADCVSSILNVPVYKFSHQDGHIVAALYSACALHLLNDKAFYSYHISGGTTECLLCSYDNGSLKTQVVAKTLDLNAGQLVDRVGLMMSLDFPCGYELEMLANEFVDKSIKIPTYNVPLKGCDCCLSGVENICKKMLEENKEKGVVAYFLFLVLSKTFAKMHESVVKEHGVLKTIFGGGVMSNSIIQKELNWSDNFYFAKREYSCDNSAGLSYLGYLQSIGER